MTWLWILILVFQVSYGMWAYYLGQRSGLRRTEKDIQHFAEVLLKQSEDIEKMRLLGKNGAVEYEDIDEFLREHRN